MTIETEIAAPAAESQEKDDSPTIRAWVVLILLTCVYSFSWMDRFLLIILIDPISKDLHVSNTEIGLLTGFGSSLIYALAGFPLARLADTGRRKLILAGVLSVWSTLTIAIGFATNFLMLALGRFGVAIASAGCSPTAYSLIADLFPAKRRGTAIALYSLGISIGTWLGLSLGGIVADKVGWRMAFLLLGAPGIVLALLFFFFTREPQRGRYDDKTEAAGRQYSVPEALKFLLSNTAFLGIAFGFGMLSFATSAFENWAPTYLIREQHLSTADSGSLSGLFQGLVAIAGALFFGLLADRLAERDRRWYLWMPMIGFCIMAPAVLMFFQVSGLAMKACYFIIEFAASSYSAPLFAAAQLMLPPRLRAFGMAAVLFVLNVIGMGAGPFFTGWLSDSLVLHPGEDGLSKAIMFMQIGGLLGLLCLALGARRMPAK